MRRRVTDVGQVDLAADDAIVVGLVVHSYPGSGGTPESTRQPVPTTAPTAVDVRRRSPIASTDVGGLTIEKTRELAALLTRAARAAERENRRAAAERGAQPLSAARRHHGGRSRDDARRRAHEPDGRPG